MTSSNGKANAYGLTTPDSWWSTTLEEVCSGDGGRIQTGPFGSQLHAHDYRDEGTPVVMPTQLGDNMISTDGIARVSDEDVERLSRHKLREGDIVFSRRGDVTRRSYITKDEEGWLCGTGCMLIRPSHENLLNEFLALFFSLPQFKDYITLNAVGATMPNLNTKILQNIPLFLPSRATQRKIVAVISAYDNLIENNTRRIAILEEMAQAIYREWFVHFRFPGHQNVKLVDSPLGQIPEGWEASRFGDVATFENGDRGKNYPKSNNFVDEGVPFINAGHLVGGIVNLREMNRIDDTTFHRLSRGKIKAGDLLMCVRGSLGRIARVGSLSLGAIASSLVIIRDSTIGESYLYYTLAGPYGQQMVTELDNGVAQPNVSVQSVKRYPLLVPSSSLLKEFEELIHPIWEEVTLLHAKCDNLRATRDLLLPKLISGKLDVEDLDIDVGMKAEELMEEAAIPKPRPAAANHITATENSKAVPPPEGAPQPTPIDELDTDYVMAEFRQEARKLGTVSRAELLKAVSQALGYRRLGTNINEALKGHLRAALRRKIIAAEGDLVCLHTPAMESYERDELIDVFKSVMRKNQEYEREDVMRALANYLGFRRLTDTVREPIKSAINGAIRRGLLGYQGELIWRED